MTLALPARQDQLGREFDARELERDLLEQQMSMESARLYAEYDSNEQFENDWDLDGEESRVYDAYDYEDEYEDEYNYFSLGERRRFNCKSCGTSNESDAQFCKHCGGRMHENLRHEFRRSSSDEPRDSTKDLMPEFKPWAQHVRSGRW